MTRTKIAFIGGGNMASSLIGGLLDDGYAHENIVVADPDEERRSQVAANFGVKVTADNHRALERADIVVLAVKPQVLETVCRSLASAIASPPPLFVSIAAGARTDAILRWLEHDVPLIRSMPNTPAAVRAGATALYATASVTQQDRNDAESLLRAVGVTVWVDDESLLDAVTALSGSGPAYFFLLMEAMQSAGESLGLAPDVARLLTLQTAFGAAKIALESGADPAVLRQRVTSPGGTTEKALEVLRGSDFVTIINKAVAAARERGAELADRLGGKNG